MAAKLQHAGKQLTQIITGPFIAALLSSDKTTPAQAHDLIELAHTNKCADTYVYRAYTGFLARAGDHRAIEEALERMRAKKVKYDANILTTLASAYFKHKMSDLVISTVKRIVDEKLHMTSTAASLMVHELAQRGELAEALRWYAQMRYTRMETNADVFKSILRVIADKGEYAEFAGVLRDMQELNIYADKTLCSHILRFYARMGFTQEAKATFEYMKAQGFVPSRSAYNALLADLSKGESEDRERLAHDMSAHGIAPSRAAYSAILAAHAKANNVTKVESIVEEMTKQGIAPKVGDYNTRMRGWAAQGNAEKCEELMRDMEEKGIKPDLYTFGSILSSYAHNITEERAKKCEEWWEKMVKMDLKPNTITYNVMLKVYDKMRWPASCARLFSEMKQHGAQPDRVTFNTLIHVYMLGGRKEKVDLLYKEMLSLGIEPDEITFACLLKLMAKKKRGPNEIANLRGEMRKRGIKMEVHMYTTLIDMYGKDGNKKGCIQIWEEMQKKGIMPSDVTVEVMKKYVNLDEFKKT